VTAYVPKGFLTPDIAVQAMVRQRYPELAGWPLGELYELEAKRHAFADYEQRKLIAIAVRRAPSINAPMTSRPMHTRSPPSQAPNPPPPMTEADETRRAELLRLQAQLKHAEDVVRPVLRCALAERDLTAHLILASGEIVAVDHAEPWRTDAGLDALRTGHLTYRSRHGTAEVLQGQVLLREAEFLQWLAPPRQSHGPRPSTETVNKWMLAHYQQSVAAGTKAVRGEAIKKSRLPRDKGGIGASEAQAEAAIREVPDILKLKTGQKRR
jgi:hypothetical protein